MLVENAVEEPYGKTLHKDWQTNWEHCVENAKNRPAMFIGNQATAHLHAVSDALALMRKARAFRAPKLSTVHLSPTKYVVRAESGRLLPAIEQVHTWSGKQVLTERWVQELEPLRQERFNKLFDTKRDLIGWKKHFASATGPTLSQPTYPAALARRFAFAYKTSEGFWGQAFRGGYPIDDPYLLIQPSAVGLLVLAELDPRWFVGLPFTANDAQRLLIHLNISVVWHDEDADLNVAISSPGDVSEWL